MSESINKESRIYTASSLQIQEDFQISEKSKMKTLVFFAVAIALSSARPSAPALPTATPLPGTVIMFLSSLHVHLQQCLFACFLVVSHLSSCAHTAVFVCMYLPVSHLSLCASTAVFVHMYLPVSHLSLCASTAVFAHMYLPVSHLSLCASTAVFARMFLPVSHHSVCVCIC